MRKTTARWEWCALALTTLACGGSELDRSSFALIDQEARAAGYTVLAGGQVADGVVPVAFDGAEGATLVHGATDLPLQAEPGELVYVHGPEGNVDRLYIGRDIEPDRVLVEGPRAVADELAAHLGGDVAAEGPRWRVTATDALALSSEAPAPAELVALAPVTMSLEGLNPWGEVAPAPDEEPEAAAPEAALGEFELDAPARELTLHAGNFPAVRGCQGVGGDWRARVYSEPHLSWVDLTLRVRTLTGGEVAGTIEVHQWSGPPEDASLPTSCDAGERWKVREPAVGSITPEGGFELRGVSWKLEREYCGVFSNAYCLDRFRGVISPDGTTLETAVSDDCNWHDKPVTLTRIRCGR